MAIPMIFNKKDRFYDYFPHLPMLRMKMDFHLGSYEQSIIRSKIQKAIRSEFDHLVDAHNLKHANVYMEIGEEFDEQFYRELKTAIQRAFHDYSTWEFLENIMPELGPDDHGNLYFKLMAIIGMGIPRVNGNGPVKLREAFVFIINYDLDALNGRELLYLTEIN